MKIVWTYNPFENNKKLQLFARKLLESFFDNKDSIEVVYVASNAETELATAFGIPVEKRYSSYPKKLIKDSLMSLGASKLKIEVLFDRSLSLSSVVKKITEYTKRNKIDLILVAANSKKILPQIIFGSFAETIIHLSICDLLVYHQNTKLSFKAPDCIVFAHDFSAKGYLGLERIILYAKKWNSNLTVVNLPIPEGGMPEEDFEMHTQKHIKKLEKLLDNENIKFNILINYDYKPIAEYILLEAEKNKANIIAVASQANKLEAFLGGSTTRQILRESVLPVLILKV